MSELPAQIKRYWLRNQCPESIIQPAANHVAGLAPTGPANESSAKMPTSNPARELRGQTTLVPDILDDGPSNAAAFVAETPTTEADGDVLMNSPDEAPPTADSRHVISILENSSDCSMSDFQDEFHTDHEGPNNAADCSMGSPLSDETYRGSMSMDITPASSQQSPHADELEEESSNAAAPWLKKRKREPWTPDSYAPKPVPTYRAGAGLVPLFGEKTAEVAPMDTSPLL
ncbi:hypothetical protein T440DRAFT_481843 [Plenodomus tracheiphilus IPT5]|uniref:Uncharacterized protein n=1 Tax=Plenodomus tracheiphilus IPT5 TaxID=1408161 RepID=A0A6A7AVX1_9PLEO|nr:hypothetical protein T440DRAFT_481843 [Plenodomus tracheiphilus IPT5]